MSGISKRRIAFSLVGALALTGCQTWEAAEAQRQAQLNSTLNAYTGETVAVFMQEQGAFRLVNFYDDAGRRVFVFENTPTVVTMQTPAFVPASPTFNNPQMAASFNNLGQVYGAPSMSQSFVSVCRLFVRARQSGAHVGPSGWIVEAVSAARNSDC